jgi:hypothetical protein
MMLTTREEKSHLRCWALDAAARDPPEGFACFAIHYIQSFMSETHVILSLASILPLFSREPSPPPPLLHVWGARHNRGSAPRNLEYDGRGKGGRRKRGSNQEIDLQQHETAKTSFSCAIRCLLSKRGGWKIADWERRVLISLHTGFARGHFA